MGAAIPLLAVDGFVTNKDEIMIKLFEQFKSADKSQSNFYNNVASLKYILNEHTDTDRIKRLVTDTLTTMYMNYFDSVDVYVDATLNGSTLELAVDITAVSNGVKHVLSLIVNGMANNLNTYNIQQDTIRGY